MYEFPLIIIGAGPAGLSTALHLLALDPAWAEKMLVLDRAVHPRHKLCGGGVTQLGLRCLRNLGFPDPLPIPHAPIRDARFIYKDRTVHVRGRPEFVVFHRREFDHFLAVSARERGVRILEGVRVKAIRIEADGVVVETETGVYRAQAVVGADGSRGISRRFLSGLARVSKPRKAGSEPAARVARLLEVVQPAEADAPQFRDGFASFDFTPVAGGLQGYAWDFPARVGGEPKHNRGVYDARIAPHRQKAPLPDLLQQALAGKRTDLNGAKIEGHPIHWFSPRNRLSSERLILAGDAAGAEPLLGEGIAPALVYGKIAARSIEAAFRKQDFSFKDYKRRVLLSDLGGYLLLRWWVAWWSYRLSDRPWFMQVMWTAGKGMAWLASGRGKE
ncbi:MAG TPA: NAD(P)/FAD-dependent oxidoreductase [Anaerolineales bacterium]|nr:NAD(P)/FAD-dependent oxidoreductase [Anaerolineales bacterium]